jgi:multiple sugar transport system permease protein
VTTTAPVQDPVDAQIAPVRSARVRRLPRRPDNPVRTTLYALVLAALTVVFLYPFIWAVSASLKRREDALNNALIPNPFHPSNYLDVFRGVPGQSYSAPFAHWFLNSAYIDTLAATTVTISSALVAFAFAYFRFPLRNLLFAFVLGSMMLPTAVTLIPTYLIWNKIHLTGTQYPLWMGNLFGSAFYIFLMRQFFLGIPRELFEAARMDGDNYWTMFWRMVVPLSKPALLVVFVFELKAERGRPRRLPGDPRRDGDRDDPDDHHLLPGAEVLHRPGRHRHPGPQGLVGRPATHVRLRPEIARRESPPAHRRTSR